jgi:galactokinase
MYLQQQMDYVLGARNMGGGFSGITIALVHKDNYERYKYELQGRYQDEYPDGVLEYIDFTPGPGAELLERN